MSIPLYCDLPLLDDLHQLVPSDLFFIGYGVNDILHERLLILLNDRNSEAKLATWMLNNLRLQSLVDEGMKWHWDIKQFEPTLVILAFECVYLQLSIALMLYDDLVCELVINRDYLEVPARKHQNLARLLSEVVKLV